MIFPTSDARKEPVRFNVSKCLAVVILTGIFLTIAFTAFWMRTTLVRSAAYSDQIVQMQNTIEGQSALLRIKTDEIASLERAVRVSDMEDSEDNPEIFTVKNSADFVSAGTSGMKNGRIELMDWFQGGSELFARYKTATVVDVTTGLRFCVRRIGGHFHADCEPLTKEDTQIMRTIYGGRWSWNRRAIVLIVGDRYIAASMNGMPHAKDPSLSNGFCGHFCIHFLHSRIHATGKECPQHQADVLYAFENGNSVI